MKQTRTPIERFYSKYMNRLKQVVNTDEFARAFMQDANKSNTTLYQRNRFEFKKFDREWIETLEDFISHIDAILHDPKRFIKEEHELKAVELAKRISRDSVRHLSQNVRYIKEIRPNGDVIPSKVLTTMIEEDFATYENRFVKTVIDKVDSFLEKRYQYIAGHHESIDQDALTMTSEVTLPDRAVVRYQLNMDISVPSEEQGQAELNRQLIQRIELLRKKISTFNNSDFMVHLKNSKPVQPPIQKTNLLTKNRDYHACFLLYEFMEAYDELGVSIEVKETLSEFDQAYINDLFKMFLVAFATFRNNKRDQLLFAKGKQPDRISLAKPKLIKKLQTEIIPSDQEDVVIDRVQIIELTTAEIKRRKKAELARIRKEKEEIRRQEMIRMKKEKERLDAIKKQEQLALKKQLEKEQRAKMMELKRIKAAERKEQIRIRKEIRDRIHLEEKMVREIREEIERQANLIKKVNTTEEILAKPLSKKQLEKLKASEKAKQKKLKEREKLKLQKAKKKAKLLAIARLKKAKQKEQAKLAKKKNGPKKKPLKSKPKNTNQTLSNTSVHNE